MPEKEQELTKHFIDLHYSFLLPWGASIASVGWVVVHHKPREPIVMIAGGVLIGLLTFFYVRWLRSNLERVAAGREAARESVSDESERIYERFVLVGGVVSASICLLFAARHGFGA